MEGNEKRRAWGPPFSELINGLLLGFVFQLDEGAAEFDGFFVLGDEVGVSGGK